MNNTTTLSQTNSTAPIRRKQRVELVALLALTAVAIWLWTAPLRSERFLRHATLQELQEYTRQHPNQARAFTYLGLSLQKSGQRDAAYQAFERAISLSPGDEEAWLGWATAAGSLHGDPEAFSILDRFVKAHPESAHAHFALAIMYQQNHAHKRAYDEAAEAARLNPQDGEAWRIASVEAMAWNRIPEAEAAARHAVAASPNDWRCRKTLGDILLTMNRAAEARTAYQDAVRLAPNSAMAHLSLGRMLLQVATTPAALAEAHTSLQQAAQRDATIPITFLLLGQCEARQERWTEARTTLEQAERLDPASADVAFELARVYRRAGDTASAAREARRHERLRDFALQKYTLASRLETRPDDVGMRLQIARLCAAHADVNEALYYYRSLLARDPQNQEARREFSALADADVSGARPASLPDPGTVSLEALLQEAKKRLDSNRYTEAKQIYLSALKRDPKSALAYEGVGLTLDAEGKDEAFFFLEHAVRLKPNLPEAQFLLGQMFNEAGFTSEASLRFDLAVHASPNNAEYWHALGKALTARSFNYAQAEEAYHHAVTLAPAQAVYLLDLADVEAESHKQDQAQADYRRALALAPDDPEVLSRVGEFLLTSSSAESGRREAETVLHKALEKNPQDDVARYNLARLALARGDAKQAVTILEEIAPRALDAADVWYALSRAYIRLGENQRAKRALANSQHLHEDYLNLLHVEEMARTNPKDASLHLKLARLNAQRGANARAINQYQLCLHLEPTNRAAKAELAELETRLRSEGRMPSMPLFNAIVASLTRKI